MKRAMLVLVLLAPFFLFAQVDPVPVNPSFLEKIPAWVPTAIGAAYELLARIIPTKSNWSIIGLVIKFVQTILPNRSSTELKKLS